MRVWSIMVAASLLAACADLGNLGDLGGGGGSGWGNGGGSGWGGGGGGSGWGGGPSQSDVADAKRVCVRGVQREGLQILRMQEVDSRRNGLTVTMRVADQRGVGFDLDCYYDTSNGHYRLARLDEKRDDAARVDPNDDRTIRAAAQACVDAARRGGLEVQRTGQPMPRKGGYEVDMRVSGGGKPYNIECRYDVSNRNTGLVGVKPLEKSSSKKR